MFNQTNLWVRLQIDWLVDSKDISLEHEGTKRHGFIRLYFIIVLINVVMKFSHDVAGLRFKVDDDLGGIGITLEESICT